MYTKRTTRTAFFAGDEEGYRASAYTPSAYNSHDNSYNAAIVITDKGIQFRYKNVVVTNGKSSWRTKSSIGSESVASNNWWQLGAQLKDKRS